MTIPCSHFSVFVIFCHPHGHAPSPGTIPALGRIGGGSRYSPTDGHGRQAPSRGTYVAKPPHKWFGPNLPIPKVPDDPDLRSFDLSLKSVC